MRAFPIVLLTVGCATAGKPDHVGNNPDGGFQHADGNMRVFLDAPAALADAPPGQQNRTLTQTTAQTITPAHSIACPATNLGTAANNYYRVFDLPSLGITTDFHVSQVSFQVEDCESSANNGAVVAVRVGTYTGTPGTTLSTAGMTVLASNATVQIPEVNENFAGGTTPGGTVNAPLVATIPAGQKLFIEVDAPDGNNTYQFYMGSNAGGQTGKGYVSSPRCTPPGTTPTDVGTLPSPPVEIDLLLTVTGTY